MWIGLDGRHPCREAVLKAALTRGDCIETFSTGRKEKDRNGRVRRLGIARVPFRGLTSRAFLSGRYQGMHLAMNVKYAFQP